MEILEQVASNVHHKISINELISAQPEVVRDAFLTNDVTVLKKYLGDDGVSVDKTTVFQL